ncbi:AAA family ATPase [Gluconacetobacter entanii]|uniref:AAA family ATPase n=1 Tax=Gluconacetobacter entanii TaxID=108528 RepID=UPI001C9327D1|nr:AAA family ATPase [Gluconacetobacter entanii]MBY4640319.1 AAA family ATPase [Gluconacetobacter entanii]MCW4579907.1 AAA family ATPase [Gluconacetobacter entanii]MCW4584620.1 AAA family ATPase [Gluconacetobacter entanii]MCW4588118.1 AAA family ATPase [Gluconacetobacter entanii]
MNMVVTDIAPTGSEQDHSPSDTLRTRVQMQMESESLSIKAAATASGIAYSTLSAWLNNKYAGDNAAVDAKVERWLESARTRSHVRQALPQEPGFIETPTAQIWMSVFEYSQGGPDIGLITGDAGVGKTISAKYYRDHNPNVWLMTADSSMRSPTAILRKLTSLVDANVQRGPGMMDSILERVRDTRGLIIVDEAQNLQTESIDLLRKIYDEAEIGLVFMGNMPLKSRIEGMGRQSSHAQIFSRVGMRKNRAKPQVKDVLPMLDAWGIHEPTLRKVGRWIAMQPGGLRTLNKTVRYAYMLTRADGRQELAEADLKSSWKELTGTELPSFAGRE